MYPGGTRKTSIVARLSQESSEKVTNIMTLRIEALSGHHLRRYIRLLLMCTRTYLKFVTFSPDLRQPASRMTFRRFAAFYAPTQVTS